MNNFFLGVAEFNQETGYTRRTIERFCQDGTLPAHRKGGQWMIHRSAVQDVMMRPIGGVMIPNEATAAWHRQQRLAQRLLAEAVADGRLTRSPCEVCGAEPTDGHHDDYENPLDVRWLCKLHHRRKHTRKKNDGT